MAVLAILQDENRKCDFRFSSFSNGLLPLENGGSSLNREVLAVLQEPLRINEFLAQESVESGSSGDFRTNCRLSGHPAADGRRDRLGQRNRSTDNPTYEAEVTH